MDCNSEYARWTSQKGMPEEYARELSGMTENEIKEAFSAELADREGVLPRSPVRMCLLRSHLISRKPFS